MPLHLIKLSVGTDSVADLEDWIKYKLKAPIDGMVAEIAIAPDAQVAEGAKVMVVAAIGQRLGRQEPATRLCVSDSRSFHLSRTTGRCEPAAEERFA